MISIYLKLSKNGEDRVPISHLFSQNEASSARIILNVMKVLVKEVSGGL